MRHLMRVSRYRRPLGEGSDTEGNLHVTTVLVFTVEIVIEGDNAINNKQLIYTCIMLLY